MYPRSVVYDYATKTQNKIKFLKFETTILSIYEVVLVFLSLEPAISYFFCIYYFTVGNPFIQFDYQNEK